MKVKMFTVPNLLTLANLACGCAAAVLALSAGERLNVAFWFVVAAAVFDFLDGMAARLTGQYSDIGVQLDSLADMVSFGVAPSAMLFAVCRNSTPLWGGPGMLYDALGWLVFAVALFSALRLARFNIDTTQASEFTGLPTPAGALLIASLGWMWYGGWFVAPKEAVIAFAAAVSGLLICPVRMFSLKFKGLEWSGNELRYIFLMCCVVLVAVLGIGGVASSVCLYVVLSTFGHFWRKSREKQAVEK